MRGRSSVSVWPIAVEKMLSCYLWGDVIRKRVASHIRSGRLAAQKVCIISLNAHTLFAVRRSPLSVGSVTLERVLQRRVARALRSRFQSPRRSRITRTDENVTLRSSKCGAPSDSASLLAAVQASTITVIAVREKEKKASAWAQISLGEKQL